MLHLILIRHSISQQQPGVSAHEWVLTDEGKQCCEQLAEHLREYTIQYIVSSGEPKAHLTAELVAQHLHLPAVEKHTGLHETEHKTAPFYESAADFRAALHKAILEPEKLRFVEKTEES